MMLLTFMSSISFAQEIEATEGVVCLVPDIVLPEYPGGNEAMFKFISENIIYPKEAEELDIQGKVIVNFSIEKDGSISNVKIIRGVHPLLDEEAKQVIYLFPKWTPGKQDGELAQITYMLPISFTLTKSR